MATKKIRIAYSYRVYETVEAEAEVPDGEELDDAFDDADARATLRAMGVEFSEDDEVDIDDVHEV